MGKLFIKMGETSTYLHDAKRANREVDDAGKRRHN